MHPAPSARDTSSCGCSHRSSMRSRSSPRPRANRRRPLVLSSPSRISLPTPEKSTPMSPKAGVRPRTSSWSVQLAKFRMLLKLKSAALPRVASSVRIPSKDALASLSRSTGALTRSARVRWRPEPAKVFIDSAGPKISVPVRTRPGTATTIWRNGPSADLLVSAIKSTSHSAALLTSWWSTVGTMTCWTSRPLRSATRTQVLCAPKLIPTTCPVVPGTSRLVDRRPRPVTSSTPPLTTKPSARSSSTARDTVALLKPVSSMSSLRVKGARERTTSRTDALL